MDLPLLRLQFALLDGDRLSDVQSPTQIIDQPNSPLKTSDACLGQRRRSREAWKRLRVPDFDSLLREALGQYRYRGVAGFKAQPVRGGSYVKRLVSQGEHACLLDG
jgi:hypothetical protein